MAISGLTVVFSAIDLALFVVALKRPFVALVVLLACIPFSGVVLDVIAHPLGTTGADRIALAAWHDALALGIIASAVLLSARSKARPPLRSIETLVVAVLGVGLISVARAPDLLSALYSYRTIYEPVALLGALLVLCRREGLPARFTRVVGVAVVGSALVAAGFAFWQVYVGGFGYLNSYYRIAGNVLPAAFQASFVTQPRAIGTFHSPNEFGAFLVLAGIVAVTPGILDRSRLRPWMSVLLGLALVLTFSRSAWVGALVALVVVAGMLGTRPRPRLGERWRGLVASLLVPAGVFVVLSLAILATSGGLRFISASVGGMEPSAMTHVGAVQDVITGVLNGPLPSENPNGLPGQTSSGSPTGATRVAAILLGDGLGTAGPKSTRFTGAEPSHHSEIWYLDFVWQVGLIGLALAGLLAGAVVATLVRSRRDPWAAAGVAGLMALGAGAVFIPVLDEPSVSLTLWALLGLAIASTRARVSGQIQPSPTL